MTIPDQNCGTVIPTTAKIPAKASIQVRGKTLAKIAKGMAKMSPKIKLYPMIYIGITT